VQVFAYRGSGVQNLDLIGTVSAIPAGARPFELRFKAGSPALPGDRLVAMATTDFGTSQLTSIAAVAKDNQPPMASVLAPASAPPGSIVVLDATLSMDPDQGPAPLEYSWRQIAGPQVEISRPNAPLAFFTAPQSGSLAFEISISDGVDSVIQQVRVSIPRRPTRVLEPRS
jgi:hypothetical protein